MLKYNNITPTKIYYRNVLVKAVKGCDGSNVWEYDEHDYSGDYLTTVALDSGAIRFINISDNAINLLQYSKNGGSWTPMSLPSVAVDVVNGDRVRWRGYGRTSTTYPWGMGTFSGTSAPFSVEGNAMSIVSGDSFSSATTMNNYQFERLFDNCQTLVSAEHLVLPSTTLTTGCYSAMFQGCTSMTKAPELPATTLAHSCYNQMFQRCYALTAAPELPATTMQPACYSHMFDGCSGLTAAPELPATVLAQECYAYMFLGCRSLTKAPTTIGTSSTTMPVSACCSMFNDCISLETAPLLPIENLANYCYYEMFQHCTSLISITCLATSNTANMCTYHWVDGINTEGTFTKAPMTIWQTGTSGIPNGWTVLSN